MTDAQTFFELTLYVAGDTPRGRLAYRNLQDVCEHHISGRYRIDVVDLIADPRRASVDRVVAIPTVVRQVPKPARRIVGDLTDSGSLISGLQLDGASTGAA